MVKLAERREQLTHHREFLSAFRTTHGRLTCHCWIMLYYGFSICLHHRCWYRDFFCCYSYSYHLLQKFSYQLTALHNWLLLSCNLRRWRRCCWCFWLSWLKAMQHRVLAVIEQVMQNVVVTMMFVSLQILRLLSECSFCLWKIESRKTWDIKFSFLFMTAT